MKINGIRDLYFVKKLVFVLITSFCFSLGGKTFIEAQSDSRVLFISSYSESYESVPEQIAGIHEALDPNNISLDIEYMDSKRFNTQENIKLFYSLLHYKLNHIKPYDAIIVGDDQALDFALEHQEELFAKIPIIFLGVNDVGRAEEAAKNPYITGLVEKQPLKENIEIALNINPNAKRIVGLVENDLTGIGHKDQFYGMVGYFPSLHFEDLNISDYSFEEMAKILQEIDDDTIILFMSMFTDKTGTAKTINEAAAFLKENTRVPVYRASIGGVGHGLLGGVMVSYHESGKIAGDMVVQILQGTPIEDIPMIDKCPYYYIFDYDVLQHFDIDEDLIPRNAILVNKEVSFIQQHFKEFLIVLGVLITSILISILLGLDNLKHRTMQRKLRESNEELSATYEELAATEEELRYQYQLIEEHVQRIERLHQKYEHAINSTNSVVWELNLKTGDVYFSNSIHNIFPQIVRSVENFDSLLNQFVDQETNKKIRDELEGYLSRKKSEINLQIPIKVKENQTRWIKVQGKSIQGNKEEENLYGILTDITQAKRQQEFIDHLAHYDYLTNLPNRMSFMKQLSEEMKAGKPVMIIMMDIDNFKEINDTMGHVWGDRVLRVVAKKLVDYACPGMFISRFGGDEFLVLSTNVEDIEERYIKQIREAFAQPILMDRSEFNIKLSMGITRFPEDSTDIDQLIMNADTALYQVKRSGKNHHLFYSQEMQQELKYKAEIEGILRKAISEEGFYLVYQPQVNVKTGKVESFEALVRLKQYNIPPNVFINIAEESELICQIGRAVTREAARQAASWRDKGYPRKPISINFSSKQMRDKDYYEFLVQTLEEYDLEPQCIEIEITESILLEETDLTHQFLTRLKDKGITIALDDFGTGFSSINYLTYIPVDKVKLDKSLCDKFLHPDNPKVIDSIISLAHSLDLVITAEGIEEWWQYEQLKKSGCNTIQGYLFSKPLLAEEAEQIYLRNFLD